MDSKLADGLRERQGGFVLVAVWTLVTVLVATGIAFMHWGSDEALQSAETTGAMQAYYLGQMGVVEKGLTWLRTRKASDLPIGETVLPGQTIPNTGRYEDIRVTLLGGQVTPGDFFAMEKRYRISCVGVVRIPVATAGLAHHKDIRRKAVLYVQVRNFADYMYLTNEERARFGDWIKFQSGDTLRGRVHSNSQIAIMGQPVFYEQVSTTADDFWRGAGYAPVFLGPPPIFNAQRVAIPDMAENLRQGAALQGNYFPDAGLTLRANVLGRTVHCYLWPTGTPVDSSNTRDIAIVNHTCIFSEGPVEIRGHLTGKVTIGSAKLVRLIDDIRYDDANPVTGMTPADSRNYLGIVSEGDVKVANTIENGRNNSNGLGRAQTNPRYTDITITAAIVALGESFTFEQQNDPDSGYVFANCPPNGTGPDDRGTIYLYGSITQSRRGYVHRGTCGSTGYLKKYEYDHRFLFDRPPCFFDVSDEEGRALFNIVQWGQGVEYRPEVRRWNMVRYN
jgi:hypothetical protein